MSSTFIESGRIQRYGLTEKSCEFVKNIHRYFVEEKLKKGFLLDPNKVCLRTAQAAGITVNSVTRIIKEKEKRKDGKVIFKTPGKQRSRLSSTDVNCFTLDNIRRRIYSCYLKGELPCVVRIAQEMKQDNTIRAQSHSSLRRIIRKNGFRYKLYSGRKIVLEKDDIIIKRNRFFKQIKNVNFQNTVWIGETSFSTPSQKNNSTKMVKIVLIHAGSHNGFIDEAFDMIITKNTNTDTSKLITQDYFTQWFKRLLNVIPSNSNIILNMFHPHNAKVNKPPNLFSSKKTVLDWLVKNNVPFSEEQFKAELLELVRLSKPILPSFMLERMATERGFNLVRTPPYHDHFNAIEIVLSKIKSEVESKVSGRNRNVSGGELKEFIEDSVRGVSSGIWKEAVATTHFRIRKAMDLEKDVENGIGKLFENIDSSKRSGREDLESITYYDEISDTSDFVTESSDEEIGRIT